MARATLALVSAGLHVPELVVPELVVPGSAAFEEALEALPALEAEAHEAHAHAARAPRSAGPRFTLGAIARDHQAELRAQAFTVEQRRVLEDLLACRTSVLGGHLDHCPACGFSRPSYNSCRNRHCPGCQALKADRWLQGQLRRALAVPYFHTVATLHPDLRPLFFAHPRLLYALLLRSLARALEDVARETLGPDVVIGVSIVLHTWNREDRYHPHAHALVPAGGLDKDGRWVDPPGAECMLPPDRVRFHFRRRLLDGVRALARKGLLPLHSVPGLADAASLERLLDRLEDAYFHAYAKATLSTTKAFRYLAGYAVNVSFSNARLLEYDGRRVRLATKNGESVERDAVELITERVRLHTLPRGFARIRHFGLLSGRQLETRHAQATAALAARGRTLELEAADPDETWRDQHERLTGQDLAHCPRCKGKAPLDRRAFDSEEALARLRLDLFVERGARRDRLGQDAAVAAALPALPAPESSGYG